MKPKGKTTARGYGSAHQRSRKRLAARLDAGQVFTCWRCGGPITKETPWDLGHDDDDRSVYRGPEHRRCNRSAGAVKGNRLRRKRIRRTGQVTAVDLW